eukprot:193376-Prymnesium_polylepis.1
MRQRARAHAIVPAHATARQSCPRTRGSRARALQPSDARAPRRLLRSSRAAAAPCGEQLHQPAARRRLDADGRQLGLR